VIFCANLQSKITLLHLQTIHSGALEGHKDIKHVLFNTQGAEALICVSVVYFSVYLF
jgi:hypothetical protein